MNKEVLRLAGLLACIALAGSRIGLIGHELVGHGAVALAAGAEVTQVKLFWFAGGWIRYVLPPDADTARLAISLGGIGFEVVVGLAVCVFVRGDSLGRRILRAAGIGLIGHGTWYLAGGVFHGFGDGIVLQDRLGESRVWVAIAAGIATCTATFIGARAITAPLARTLPGSTRQRAIGFAVAAVLAGGLHAGLTVGELQLRRDAAYSRIMKPANQRRIARELEAWEREQAARGATPSDDARRVERRRLEDRHRTFPFVVVLAIATLACFVAGIARSRGGREERIAPGLLLRAVIVAVASICAVIVLDAVLPG